MKDKEIDEILKRAAQTPPDLDPAVLDSAVRSIGASLRPVRQLPAAWLLTTGLALICTGVALVGGAFLGLHGIHVLSALECALIFSLLAVLICLAAMTYVGEMIPGSRRRVPPGALLWGGASALIAVFAILFRDYGTDHYFSQGLTCLKAGLLHAIPAGLAGWLLLRRGFAVDSIAAGLAAGILAGLAGLTMLELHCPNFQVLHVMLWHTAVMVVSGGGGALLAWMLRLQANESR